MCTSATARVATCATLPQKETCPQAGSRGKLSSSCPATVSSSACEFDFIYNCGTCLAMIVRYKGRQGNLEERAGSDFDAAPRSSCLLRGERVLVGGVADPSPSVVQDLAKAAGAEASGSRLVMMSNLNLTGDTQLLGPPTLSDCVRDSQRQIVAWRAQIESTSG